ncbi:MAG: transposase [Blastocatellia bacterium]|nr:transposase [Blastocatellia bacterium]
MKHEKSDESGLRRKLFRLFDKGKSIRHILKLIPRSRAWLYKWRARYQHHGARAAPGAPTTPRHSPQAYPPAVIRLVLQVRQRLQRETVGLIGAKAIRRELQRRRLLRDLPSISTIHRILKRHGLVATAARPKKESSYPAPQLSAERVFHAMDWMLRYLEGGEKVFIFHTIDLQTHELAQTLAHNKSVAAVRAHALQVWQAVGLPDFLQIDNDAAFTGLGRKGRIFGQFVRLALYLGIELMFIPPSEPQRNHRVEGVNHLFSRSFWEKNHFANFRAVERRRGKFLRWYQDYEPPALAGLSIKAARRKGKRRKLRASEVAALPAALPLTTGRLHFIRQVSPRGEIEILKEKGKVSRWLAGRYVWAIVNTGPERLQIYYRASPRHAVQLLQEYAYEVGEKVLPLQERYRRSKRVLPAENLF